MQRLYKKFIPALIAGIFTAGLVSCEKYNEWEVEEGSNRLFRPTEVTAAVDGVTATLTWKGKPNIDVYTVELSKDSLKFTEILKSYSGKAVKNADGYSFVVPDLLEPQTRYSARIKGVDTLGTTPESKWATVTFVSKTEQIMKPVTDADLTFESVTLKWNVPNSVSHFMIGSTRYDITPSERVAGEKTITGLSAKTNYTATLYFNNSIRGSQNFKTLAKLPTGPNVEVLQPGDDLAAKIAGVTDGKMLVLLQGSVYTSDVLVNIPTGVSFTIWGEEGPNKPVIAFNGLNLPATAGTIKFENVDLTGYQYSGGVQTATKRNYIFNQSAATVTDEIAFENCTIRNFVNTPMRMQGSNSITLGKFTVNKCIINDIGDNLSGTTGGNGTYAFINNSVATSKINNISITNNTFSKIGYGLILHGSSSSSSVIVENNTFYNVIGTGRFLIDYNGQTVGSFSFKNNILGKTLAPSGGAKGIRYSGTNLIVVNSYQTSDAVIATTNNPIPNITSYSKTSADLFTDPNNGNFLIKDGAFDGASNAGDPRWRP